MKARSVRPGKTIAAAFLIAVVVGVAAGIALGADDARPRIGGWPEDVDGDGVVSDVGDERIPALIGAVGDNGVEGYVRFDDLEGPQPSTPEEALKMSGQERVIPVFAEDGTTVVDHYTIGSGRAGESPSPVPAP